jgi:lysyl-tRNA synthetase, class II
MDRIIFCGGNRMSEEQQVEQSLSEVLQVRRDKLQAMVEAGRDPFRNEKFERTNLSQDIILNFEALDGYEVKIAGRIMAKRQMGKAMFLDIQDSAGRIQSYVRKDRIGDEEFDWAVTYDIGDIVGITGEVFKTQKEEISVKASSVIHLSKSLQVLPEKYHGLKDTELRYRQRYLDLIVNPGVKQAFVTRSKIIKAIREYLDSRGYLEVETPILQTIPGGAAARPFVTHHNTLDIDMYMRIANELYLKRLIIGGFDRVYEMGRMFRNEGMSQKHNPEYTAIELYAAYEDYEYMMELTENLVAHCCEMAHGTTKVIYDGKEIDFKPPWNRISMTDAVKKYAGVDFKEVKTDEEAREIGKKLGLPKLNDSMTKGHIINETFEQFCEEHLVQPTFIMHHPVEVSPLAKRNPDDPSITNRFEAFVNTWEIGNAFSELNDPIDQRGRFEDQIKQREGGDDEAHLMDEDFLHALEVGMPPTAGLGIGIDRLVMLLTNCHSIRDVLFFPTMKITK